MTAGTRDSESVLDRLDELERLREEVDRLTGELAEAREVAVREWRRCQNYMQKAKDAEYARALTTPSEQKEETP